MTAPGRTPTVGLVIVLVLAAGCLSGGTGAGNPGAGGTETAATTATPTTTETPTETRSVPVRPYDTRAELEEHAPFAVPDSDVPGNFSFDSGIVGESGNATRVSLAYHHVVGEGEDAELRNVLSVEKFAGSPLNLSQGEAVTVEDREMRYVAGDDDGRTLLWRCGGFTYRVGVQQFGDGFEKADLFDVAASVECDDGTTTTTKNEP